MTYVSQYFTVLVIFVAVDLLWLGILARSFYRVQLDGLITDRFNVAAATAFYLMYPAGIVLFAVAPAASGKGAAALGAALGFFAYATYDLTNLATLRRWPLRLTVVDMLWGTTLTAISAAGGRLLVGFAL